MKNRRLCTKISIAMFFVIAICIYLLYIAANRSMTTMMRQAEMKNLHDSLRVETNIIQEYIYHQEDLLKTFSNSPVVIDYLKERTNEEKRKRAQEYTENYYAKLDQWEGLYIGEWNTHVIAHSNPDVVGMITRKGEPLKELQTEMEKGLYNAGIIISPASQKLILSLYCPVYDYDGKTILGYVGGGPFANGLRELLASVENESAWYYMINAKSKMYIFAQDEALMATQIQDEMLLDIISEQEGNGITGDKEFINEKGEKSIAAYQYIPEYDWIVVSCNSEENIYANVSENMKILGIICVFSVLFLGFLAWIFILFSTKPLKYVEKAIVQLQKLKLEKEPKLEKYIGCESEIGQIATAVDSLYDSIGDMLDAEKEKQIAIAKSESKAKFVASMSHEIRTPINTVIGMNEMILRECEEETIKEYAYNIKSASQMLLGLINDVLDFSKMEAGKLQIIESKYRVDSVIKDAILGVDVRVKQKNLELKLDIEETLPSALKGDEIRIRQILNNLLSNAAKYTEKGSITFSVKGIQEKENFILQFMVTDTGIGIRQEDKERLFESFSRLDMKKNRYIEGTGLGLNITKQLVDNMSGTITVESEYGKGSCFTVRIPQEIVEETPLGKWEERMLSGIGEESEEEYLYVPEAKVLVVDDNQMNLMVIEGLLKRSGIQLDLASGGNECLAMSKQKKYDLILMDHMMPEPNGIQTLKRMREDPENANRETDVIVLTANALMGAEAEYLKEGFSAYLSKPIMVDKLEETLGRFLLFK